MARQTPFQKESHLSIPLVQPKVRANDLSSQQIVTNALDETGGNTPLFIVLLYIFDGTLEGVVWYRSEWTGANTLCTLVLHAARPSVVATFSNAAMTNTILLYFFDQMRYVGC